MLNKLIQKGQVAPVIVGRRGFLAAVTALIGGLWWGLRSLPRAAGKEPAAPEARFYRRLG